MRSMANRSLFIIDSMFIAQGADPSVWLTEWIVRDVLYRIAVGALVGGFVGWVLGRSLFSTSDQQATQEHHSYCV
jgi:NhaP-type Na+/H+ or K+/H+ antiporter